MQSVHACAVQTHFSICVRFLKNSILKDSRPPFWPRPLKKLSPSPQKSLQFRPQGCLRTPKATPRDIKETVNRSKVERKSMLKATWVRRGPLKGKTLSKPWNFTEISQFTLTSTQTWTPFALSRILFWGNIRKLKSVFGLRRRVRIAYEPTPWNAQCDPRWKKKN